MTRLSDLVRNHSLAGAPVFPAESSIAEDSCIVTSAIGQLAPIESEGSDWYERAFQELSQLKRAIHAGQKWNVRKLATIAAGLVHSLESTEKLVGTVLRGASRDYLIGNMVNVAVLAVKIAAGLEFKTENLERVALAGLMHDLGMFSLPDGIVYKSEPLSAEERRLLQEHPQRGAELLRGVDETYRWVARVVMQEQERWDGTGYPHRMRGDAIDEMALIIGLADAFDAMISPRLYRNAVVPHQALRALLTTDKARFPHHLLKALIEQLSMYPLGTTVRLNTGDTGVVSELNKKYPLRPILLVRQQSSLSFESSMKMVDLSANTSVQIIEVLQPTTAQ